MKISSFLQPETESLEQQKDVIVPVEAKESEVQRRRKSSISGMFYYVFPVIEKMNRPYFAIMKTYGDSRNLRVWASFQITKSNLIFINP